MSNNRGQLEFDIHPMSLSFRDRLLEKEFTSFNDSEIRVFNQIGIILSYFAWLALGIFSYISYYESFPQVAKVIIFWLYPVFTLNLLVLNFHRFVKYHQPLTTVTNISAGLGVVFVGQVVLENYLLTICGLTVVCMFIFYIYRQRFKIAVPITLISVVLYQVTLLGTSEVGMYSLFLWVLVITCVVGGNIMERANRKMFIQNKLRQIAEAENRDKDEFLNNMFNLVSVPIVVAEENHRILESNPASRYLFGEHQRYLEELFVPSKRHRKVLLRDFMNRKPIHNFEAEVLNREGKVISTLISVNFVERKGRKISICAIQDISDRKKLEEKTTYLAYHDPLTGLPNRLQFSQQLKHYVDTHQEIAVLFMDLDKFKMINDTRGHMVGDKLLQKVAQRLINCVSEEGTVFRIGGDEFTVILLADTRSEVSQVAERILAEIRKPLIIENYEINVMASIGISLYPTDGDNVEELIKGSDFAMYKSKVLGGNKHKFFNSSMSRSLEDRVNLEGDLHNALNNDELVLHYQPQIDPQTGYIFGAEALIRWQHPERGLVPPDQFIPIAEETGLIIPIGEWVLRKACIQAEEWNRKYGHPVHIAVNLSVKQFVNNDIVGTVERTLQETGLNPNNLELELTESIFLENNESVVTSLNELKRLGVRISIDDFGTGYSSLAYLKDLPIDSIKIDQSFIRSLSKNKKTLSIISAIIDLAQELELKSVAEGVETTEQFNYFKMEGCDLVQGYYFSRPLPADQLEVLLDSPEWDVEIMDNHASAVTQTGETIMN